MKKFLVLIMLLFTTSLWGGEYYVVSGALQFLAKPDGLSYPALLGTYTDAYGQTVRRMTDEEIWLKPNYTASISTIENADGTMFAVNKRKTSTIWDIFTVADGTLRGNLTSFGVSGESDYDNFVWHPTIANVGYLMASGKSPYATYPTKLWKITINTETWAITGEVLKTFTYDELMGESGPGCPGEETFNAFFNKDEGPASWDGRYWGIAMQCSGDADSSDEAARAVLIDRDGGGSEVPTIKGWVPLDECIYNGERVVYSVGVSPGGTYFFWRNGATGLSFVPVASVSGETAYSGKTDMFSGGWPQPHWNVQYDDLGNEVFVGIKQGDSGGNHRDVKYWRFDQAPSNGITAAVATYWCQGSWVGPCGASHWVPAGVISGPRSWVAMLPTSNTAGDEYGYESIGASTITFVHLSATNPKVFRVVQTLHESQNYDVGEYEELAAYNAELHGGASRDGTKFYYHSTWGTDHSQQIFRVELPADWWTEIFGGSGPTPPLSTWGQGAKHSWGTGAKHLFE